MSGIYIHIPYCKQACNYCDFHFSTSQKNKKEFIGALLKEMVLRKNYFDDDQTIHTIYFGGGTPSLLTQDDLNKIFSALTEHFSIASDAEITMEANPDDLSPEKLTMLSKFPVNRLSIGIQSFIDEELRWMNRSHNSSMAVTAVKEAQAKGFHNISADLIYGSPLLTNAQWISNLEKIFSLNVQHLSCYNLTIEEKTLLSTQIKKGLTVPPDENKSAEQLKILMQLAAENGFEQYEISNFCRNHFYSRHNSSYWNGSYYLGLGPSAHSFNGISRQWNIAANAAYIRGTANGNLLFTMETLSKHQAYNEYIMTGLRTTKGTDEIIIKEKFGWEYSLYFSNRVKRHISDHFIVKNNSSYTLSEAGKFFADRIAADLFIISDEPEPREEN